MKIETHLLQVPTSVIIITMIISVTFILIYRL